MNNELVIFNKDNTEKQMFTTIDLSTKENKAKLFNASENCDVLANDCVGTRFVLKEIYIERIPRINEETGEQEIKYRTILFDEDGKTYVTTAFGVYNTVTKIINIYGINYIHEDGLEVEIAKGKTKDNKTKLFLKVIG